MSTRKLIIAALVCGIAILVAGAVQFLQIASSSKSSQPPPPVVATTRPSP